MPEDFRSHLTPAQLNTLVTDRATPQDEADAQAHIAVCSECAAGLARYRRAEEVLKSLKDDSEAGDGGACPTEENWADLATGGLDDAKIYDMVEHAAQCATCAVQLRVATYRDETRIAQDSPASVKWGWSRWATAALAAALALTAGLVWLRGRSHSPDTLLAEAFSAARPFEMRYPGAAYGPVRNTRSAQGALSRPKKLVEAEMAIREAPENARSLYLKGALELLNQNYDPAIHFLEQAQNSAGHPDETGLLLAISLYQRGVLFHTADRRQDFVEALDLFHGFAIRHPGDPTVLFDLALCYEAVEDLIGASEIWKTYLELERDSSWSTEARAHLSAIEKRLQERGRVAAPATADPEAFIRLAGSGNDFLPELYLPAALIAWLPQMDRSAAHRALEILSTAFLRRSADSHLAELLAAPGSAAGFKSLALAVEANRGARHIEAELESGKAAMRFAEVGNTPGVLRSRAERLYALHRLYRADCLDEGIALDHLLRNKPYRWLRTQVRLELANCNAFRNDYGRAAKLADEALGLARESKLPDLELRATGLLSAFHFYAGDASASIRECLPALSSYWQAAYPPNRAQQCFHDLSLAADNLGWHYAAAAFARHKISVMLETQELLVEARGRVSLARLYEESGDHPAARHELNLARQLFDRVPGASEKRPLVLDALLDQVAVGLAGSESPTALLAELAAVVGTDGSSAPTVETRLRALELLARAHLKQKHFEAARAELTEAIKIHRGRLAGLASDWERSQSEEQYANLYRLLADVQFPDDDKARAAFLTWSLNRAIAKTSGAPAGRDGKVLGIACLPGGPVAWVASGESIAGWRIGHSNDELRRQAEQLAEVAANRESSAEAIDVAAREIKANIFAGSPTTTSRNGFDAVDLDTCLAMLPLPLLFPEGVALGSSGERRQPLLMQAARGLILASPRLGGEMASSYSALPDVRLEADAVAAQVHRAEVLSGSAATLDGLARHRQGAAIVHFAGHGVGFGGSGALLMSPADSQVADFELLTALTIGKQNWTHCELAVLSGCSTAGGRGHSKASTNLVRALLAAGALRVVASTWNVDSTATRVLMEGFYKNLRMGQLPAQALAQAAASVRAQPQWRHPYYWAGFQLYGHT